MGKRNAVLEAESDAVLVSAKAFLGRESLAKVIAIKEGTPPNELIENGCEEDARDGLLPNGQWGHFAWRDHLWKADI